MTGRMSHALVQFVRGLAVELACLQVLVLDCLGMTNAAALMGRAMPAIFDSPGFLLLLALLRYQCKCASEDQESFGQAHCARNSFRCGYWFVLLTEPRRNADAATPGWHWCKMRSLRHVGDADTNPLDLFFAAKLVRHKKVRLPEQKYIYLYQSNAAQSRTRSNECGDRVEPLASFKGAVIEKPSRHGSTILDPLFGLVATSESTVRGILEGPVSLVAQVRVSRFESL
jgi:hypothetical protein